jgi:hypothetical protein
VSHLQSRWQQKQEHVGVSDTVRDDENDLTINIV